jgi:hypothetical protein
LTVETADRITKEITRMLTEVRVWMKECRVPEKVGWKLYDEVVKENGIMARVVASKAAKFAPVTPKPIQLEALGVTIGKLESGEFRSQLMSEPEPAPEELTEFLRQCRDAVPSLARHFANVGKRGPQRRHGGRLTKLADPKVRLAICVEIKRRREPRVTLEEIFKAIAKNHDVSPSKIKQIWLESSTEKLEKD